MSFSSVTKDEICTLVVEQDCCIIAELCALTLICGNLSVIYNNSIAVLFFEKIIFDFNASIQF